jgi:hypothetical protein
MLLELLFDITGIWILLLIYQILRRLESEDK